MSRKCFERDTKTSITTNLEKLARLMMIAKVEPTVFVQFTWSIKFTKYRDYRMMSATLVHFAGIELNNVDLLVVKEVHTLIF